MGYATDYTVDSKIVKCDVKYTNKDFASIRSGLIEFAKQYFPNTYNDFNEASPGMMLIEMMSYVGDNLSYYIDTQFKETLFAYAEEKKSVVTMAQSLGYKPLIISPSEGLVDVFQTVPSTGVGDNVRPDLNYGLTIPSGMEIINQNTSVKFRTLEDVNFKYSGSNDPLKVSIYEQDSDGVPSKYLLKKQIKIKSGEIRTETFTFAAAKKYNSLVLSNPNVTEVISVSDSDGKNWTEVDFLAQDTVFTEVETNASNDPELAGFSDDTPYLLRLRKTAHRFTTFIRDDNKTELRFGAGVSDNEDEEIIPNPNMVGSNLPQHPSAYDRSYDPSNFLTTKAYGLAPSNTTLTVKYAIGGGVDHNSAKGDVNQISDISYSIDTDNLSSDLVDEAKASVAVTNPIPTTGGSSGETIREIRENALAFFKAQGRAVTKEDYIVRVYSLPAKFGKIAKAYVVQDEQLNQSLQNVIYQTSDEDSTITQEQLEQIQAQMNNQDNRIPNPLALNLYVLGYDSAGRLTQLNAATKENLRVYLSRYRVLTDAINIKNAYIINIGLKINIITLAGYNKEEVILKVINNVKEFWKQDKWQINQPIVVQEISNVVAQTEGVAAVIPPQEHQHVDNPHGLPLVVFNRYKTDLGYSGNIYDIGSATKNGVIYPSLDPSMFELKFPNTDIEVRVVGNSGGSIY